MLIGMNVDLGDTMVNTLTSQSDSLNDELNRLRGQVDNLLNTWQGASRSTFENEWQPWVQQVNELVSLMQQMRDRLRVTVNGFREADVF